MVTLGAACLVLALLAALAAGGMALYAALSGDRRFVSVS